MIIPIKCFSCGKVLADKYQYYIDNVQNKNQENSSDTNKVIYLSNTTNTKTSSGKIMDELGLTKMCCRRHILSHVDIE